MKFNVLDLYAGTGRSLEPFLAWSQTGRTFLADNSEYAAAVYRHNFPSADYRVFDLNRVATSDLAAFVGGPVDILLGCPPCQGFSDCGLKNSRDPRNRHVSRFHAIVRDLRPRFLAMENVPLVVTSRRFRRFARGLEELGYVWTAAIVNAVLWGAARVAKDLSSLQRRVNSASSLHFPSRRMEDKACTSIIPSVTFAGLKMTSSECSVGRRQPNEQRLYFPTRLE